MATLGKFFERAAQKVKESVGNNPKTVDGDFEARKDDQRNYEKVAETTRAIYGGEHSSEFADVFEQLSRKTLEALAAYETAWQHTADMMRKYDAIIKHMGRRIQERDGCRVDFDRARSKWEKSNNDPVAEATARASEQVYLEKHHSVSDNLDFFLAHRNQHIDAIMCSVAQATVAYYSFASAFPSINTVTGPSLEMSSDAAPAVSAPPARPAQRAPPSPRQSTQPSSPREAEQRASGSSPSANALKPSVYAVKKPAAASATAAKPSNALSADKRSSSVANVSPSPKPQAEKQHTRSSSTDFGTYGAKPAPAPKKPIRCVRMLYDFTPGEGDSEGLAVKEGDVLNLESDDGDWLMCVVPSSGASGYVPATYTEPI